MAAKVRTSADFAKAHDKSYIIPEKFRTGVKALGPKGWMYLGDFQRANHINPSDGADHRDKFKEFMFEVDRKFVICGSAKLAKELKASLS